MQVFSLNDYTVQAEHNSQNLSGLETCANLILSQRKQRPSEAKWINHLQAASYHRMRIEGFLTQLPPSVPREVLNLYVRTGFLGVLFKHLLLFISLNRSHELLHYSYLASCNVGVLGLWTAI